MAEHIHIRHAEGTWTVRAGGAILGETTRALELTEGDYPPVIYFPREDIAMAFLDKSEPHLDLPVEGRGGIFHDCREERTHHRRRLELSEPETGCRGDCRAYRLLSGKGHDRAHLTPVLRRNLARFRG